MSRQKSVRAAVGRGRGMRGIRVEALEARTLLTAIAVDDFYNLNQGAPFQAAPAGVLANDVIASGSPLTAALAIPPANGTVALNPDGSFTYTPAAGFSGVDSFTYTASDALGGVDTGVVTLGVMATAATEAEITAGPRLASVDSARGELLNAVLGGLLGSGLSVDVLDWNRLAQGDVDALSFLDALQAELGAASTSEALSADATLFQVFSAAADAAQAGGDTLLANAFDGLAAQVTGLTGTVQVGDLLQVDPNDGSLADADLDALDLVTGGVQLFNYENVATTATPITLSGAALGLGGVFNSVTLSAQVVEPPVYVVGPAGTAFHTAATRLRLDLDLVDVGLDVGPLLGNLLGPLQGLVGAAVDVSADASLGQLSLYVEVAQGTGTLQMIDAVSNAVTIQGTPGVADVYLGTIPDTVFFNRAAAISPADVAPVEVGSLALGASLLGVPVVSTGAGLMLRGLAQGQAPLASSLVYNGPFPQTQTFGSSAAFLTNLLNTLTSSLELTLDGPLDGVFNGLTGTVLSTISPLVRNAVSPVLNTALVGLVDPALETLGVGIGEMDVTVSPLAAAASPLANADFARGDEGSAVTIPVLANDSNTAAGGAFVTSFTQPANGSVVLNADGTLTYTPDSNFSGVDTFGYIISDGSGGTSSALVTVQVLAVNDAPVANPDAYSVVQDTPLTIPVGTGVLSNDSDADGDPLSATVITGPANGTLALNPDGSFTYTPNTGFTGADSFTYQASDGALASAPVTVALNVSATPNATPVAAADAYTTDEDTPLSIPVGTGVLANDADGDGDPLTAVLVAAPTNGTLTLNPDGSFDYTPGPNFNGVDSFTYQASDGSALSAPIVVTITVAAVNDAPLALPDAYTVAEGGVLTVPPRGVLANDSDPDGDALTSGLATGPANGTLTFNADGSFVYTPNPGFSGVDSFTYQAWDGALATAPITVAITVAAVDDPPAGAPDAYSVAEDGSLVVPAATGVLANDSDPEGGPIAAELVSGPANGTLAINPDGSFSYTPGPNFNGVDSFTYRASDGSNTSAPIVVTIGVTPVNDAPAATPDSYAIDEDGTLVVPAALGVLANDADPDGDALTSGLATGPANGTLTFNADGSFVYTPNPGFSGVDSFTYQAWDGALATAPITVAINVAAVDDPPAGAPDAYSVAEDGSLVVPAATGVLANDSDPEGGPIAAELVSGPANGTLAINPDGSFSYTPNPDYFGPDGFVYRPSDGVSVGSPITVVISVNAADDAPVARPDSYATPPGGGLTVPGPGVLGNDADPDGDPVTAVLVEGPRYGTVVLNPDGSFAYTPSPGYFGPDSFSYVATGGGVQSPPVTVTINAQAAPTQVVGLERYGYHRQPTQLVLRFNAGLDASAAQDLANYRLVGAGRDGRLGTRDDVFYQLGRATYDAASRSVTLSPTQLIALRGKYRLVVRGGAGALTASGVPIDGDRDGAPGGDALIDFDQTALAGPSTASNGRPGRPSPRAVDAVFTSRGAGRLALRGTRFRWRA